MNRYERAIKLSKALSELPEKVKTRGNWHRAEVYQCGVSFYVGDKAVVTFAGASTLEAVKRALEWIAMQRIDNF